MSRSLHRTTHFALSQRPVSTSHGVWPPQIATLGDSSTPVPDQVLYASDETVSCEGFPEGKIDIKQLAQPLVQGAELPDYGGGDETERNHYLWTFAIWWQLCHPHHVQGYHAVVQQIC